MKKLPTPEGLEDLAESLSLQDLPLEMTMTPGTPNTPPTSTLDPSFGTSDVPAQSTSGAETSNHILHDNDTDVEMEKMVSKVCD